MRDIKFRVWRKDDKKMYGPDLPFLIYTDGVIPSLAGDVPLRQYAITEAVLMQYTGLKDKNGREIYEGDILSHDVTGGIVGVVCWSEGLYRFVIEKDDEIVADLCDYDFEPEIDGNIYEDKELLHGW